MPNLINCNFKGVDDIDCCCKTCKHAWELETCCNVRTYHVESHACTATCSGYIKHSDKPYNSGKQIKLGGLL